MMNKNTLIEIALYLRGSTLDPHYVSGILGVEPTRSQLCGESRTSSSGVDYCTRIGMWVLSSKSDSGTIEEAIVDFLLKIPSDVPSFLGLDGVDDAYVDIFIAVDANEDGGGSCEFQLGADKIVGLNRLDVPVRFTVAVVKP
jgi:hypothetical protein